MPPVIFWVFMACGKKEFVQLQSGVRVRDTLIRCSFDTQRLQLHYLVLQLGEYTYFSQIHILESATTAPLFMTGSLLVKSQIQTPVSGWFSALILDHILVPVSLCLTTFCGLYI